MSFFLSFSPTLNAGQGLRNDKLICLAVLHTQYKNYTLATKGFGKIIKNVKCNFKCWPRSEKWHADLSSHPLHTASKQDLTH